MRVPLRFLSLGTAFLNIEESGSHVTLMLSEEIKK